MPTVTYDNTDIAVDDEGFFTEPARWTEPMAEQVAKEAGIDTLTDRHWIVIRFMRDQYAAKGTGPTVRAGLRSGLDRAERARARQGLRGERQGALPALPQGTGEDGREDRRYPQAPRLHLRGSARS